jgi:hypothetical protein
MQTLTVLRWMKPAGNPCWKSLGDNPAYSRAEGATSTNPRIENLKANA